MKAGTGSCVRSFLFLSVILLLISGCVTPDYRSFYYMDLRSYPVPVMVNADPEALPGRQFRAVVSEESSVQQSTYYGYDYTVTTTTTKSSETRMSLDSQLLTRANPSDNLIRIHAINFYTHFMGMPGYSENYQDMSVDVSYHMQKSGD
jgi:hypothetical protein